MFKLVALFAVLAVASAKPQYITAYQSPLVATYPGAPVVATYPAAAYPVGAYPAATYPVPALSLPPNSPATLVGAGGHPLDTPEVNVAKALHYQAKALSYHGIHKRDVITPLAYSAYTPLVNTYPKPIVSAYSAPYLSSISAHGIVAPTTYVHPW